MAGIDEVKNEVTEIVDFLRDPDKYRRLGAKIPQGVLLSGPPGGGKTLLARAVAGEAQVPFFSISASEFIEAIVGVGASRVRDLFDQAKKAAPAIIFIDELDSIGRARGGAQSLGGNDEREQTLDQILTEMDGFTGTEGVVVLAATNRPEMLDPALLRPGRFDRRVTVSPPDLDGRRKILAVHTRDVPLAPDVDLDAVAAATPGMVGADLGNLVNEAALLAARRGHAQVGASRLHRRAGEGRPRHGCAGSCCPAEERERTAYHEAGHALAGHAHPRRGSGAEGVDHPAGAGARRHVPGPAADRYGYTEDYLRGPHRRRPRRARRRGGGVRRHQHRRRERPRPGQQHRPADGRPMGHVGRRRPAHGAAAARAGVSRSAADPIGARRPRSSSTGRPGGSSTNATSQAVATLTAHRGPARPAGARPVRRHETLDEDEAYAAAGVTKESAPGVGAEHEPSRPVAVVAAAASSGDRPGT